MDNNNNGNNYFLQSLNQSSEDSNNNNNKSNNNNNKKTSKHDRCIFQSVQFALAIVRNPFTQKWLAVNETNGRGWWVPGGCVERGETFEAACLRECRDSAGIRVALKGILKVDHSVSNDVCRMRVIYYCEPTSQQEANNFKTMPDAESLEARWVSVNELLLLANGNPGLRGRELLNWAIYLENNGHVMPLEIFGEEGELQPLGSHSKPLQLQRQQREEEQQQQQNEQQQQQQRKRQQQQQQLQQQASRQQQLQQLQSQLQSQFQPAPFKSETNDNLLFLQQYHDPYDNMLSTSVSTGMNPQQKEFMEWANAKRKDSLKYEAV